MSLSSLIAMNKTIFFLSFLIGGEMIQDECDDIMAKVGGFLSEGMVKVTSAGNLKCKFIMHAVGPIWKDGNSYETEFLAETITNCLLAADQKRCNSIAIPAFITGNKTYLYLFETLYSVLMYEIFTFCEESPWRNG